MRDIIQSIMTQASLLACVFLCSIVSACSTQPQRQLIIERASPVPELPNGQFTHGDWVSTCDNTGACTLIGMADVTDPINIGRVVRAAITLTYPTQQSPLPEFMIRLYEGEGHAFDPSEAVSISHHPAAGGLRTDLQRELMGYYRLTGPHVAGYVNAIVQGHPLIVRIANGRMVTMPDPTGADLALRAIRPAGLPIQPRETYNRPNGSPSHRSDFERPTERFRGPEPVMTLLDEVPPEYDQAYFDIECRHAGVPEWNGSLANRILVYSFLDGSYLWRVSCNHLRPNSVEMLFYQMLPDTRPLPVLWQRRPIRAGMDRVLFSNLTIDPQTGHISATHYEDFDQSCGSFEVWDWRVAGQAELLEARQMPLCHGLPQSDWPRTYFQTF